LGHITLEDFLKMIRVDGQGNVSFQEIQEVWDHFSIIDEELFEVDVQNGVFGENKK
jgi:hypothetical protein